MQIQSNSRIFDTGLKKLEKAQKNIYFWLDRCIPRKHMLYLIGNHSGTILTSIESGTRSDLLNRREVSVGARKRRRYTQWVSQLTEAYIFSGVNIEIANHDFWMKNERFMGTIPVMKE